MDDQVGAAEEKSVYGQIKELLISYTFFPGDRLHVSELADQLRVSATPVREALSKFCAEGLLTAVPHRGFYVKKLDQEEIADLFAMKHMLLSYAVRGRVSQLLLEDSELRVLERLAQLGQSGGNTSDWLEVYELYAAPMILLIGSLAENAALLDCLGNTLDRLHFVRRTEVRMDDCAESVFRDCAAIAQALLERKEGEIQACFDRQLQHEINTLPDLMKECVNRLYMRGQPASSRQSTERRPRLVALSA